MRSNHQRSPHTPERAVLERLRSAGGPEALAHELRNAREVVTANPRLLCAAADRYRKFGRPACALELYRAALELSPGDAYAVTYRGWSELALGRVSEAERSFLLALKCAPGSADARNGLCESYIKQRRWSEARALARERVLESPKEPKPQALLESVELRSGAALNWVEQFASMLGSAKFERVNNALPMVARAAGDLRRLKQFKIAIRPGDSFGDSLPMRNFVNSVSRLCERGFAAAGLQLAVDALTIDPCSPPLLCLAGQAALKCSEYRAAAAAYRRTLFLRPENAKGLEGIFSVVSVVGGTPQLIGATLTGLHGDQSGLENARFLLAREGATREALYAFVSKWAQARGSRGGLWLMAGIVSGEKELREPFLRLAAVAQQRDPPLIRGSGEIESLRAVAIGSGWEEGVSGTIAASPVGRDRTGWEPVSSRAKIGNLRF